MRTILFLLFFLSTFAAIAQQADKAYYKYNFRLIGSTETLIVPEGNHFILQRNSRLGSLGHTLVDTLIIATEGLKGKYVDVHFTEKGIVVQSRRSDEIAKAREYKEFDVCDPFVNKIRNAYYGNRLRNEVNRLASEKIGSFNKEWQGRPYLLVDSLISMHNEPYPFKEQLIDKLSNNKRASLSEYRHSEFKAMADSAQLIKFDLISSILAKKQLRKERFMSDTASITIESISTLLPEVDNCRTDQELFVFLAEKVPHELMQALVIATKSNPTHYFPIYHLPKEIDTSLAKHNLLSITPKSRRTEEMIKNIKKYWR